MNQKPTFVAELIAEFLGTFVLMLFGIGVVAMVVLFPSKNPGETVHGGFTNITLGWGLAVTMGIYSHVTPGIQSEAVAKLDLAFGDHFGDHQPKSTGT